MMFEQNLNTVSTRAKPCFEVLLRYYVVTFLSDRTLILLLQTILFLHWMHTNLGFRLKLKSNQKNIFTLLVYAQLQSSANNRICEIRDAAPTDHLSLPGVCSTFWQNLKYDSVIEKHK